MSIKRYESIARYRQRLINWAHRRLRFLTLKKILVENREHLKYVCKTFDYIKRKIVRRKRYKLNKDRTFEKRYLKKLNKKLKRRPILCCIMNIITTKNNIHCSIHKFFGASKMLWHVSGGMYARKINGRRKS